MSTTTLRPTTIAVIGAGGKMGMRVSEQPRQDRPHGLLRRELPRRRAAHDAMRVAS